MRNYFIFLLILVVVGCRVQSDTGGNDENGGGGTGKIESFNIFLPAFSDVKTINITKSGLVVTGMYNSSSTLAVLSNSGKVVQSLKLKDNLFINDTVYDPGENALYLAGQYGNKYAYVGKYSVTSNKIEWEKTFGSDIENREFVIRGVELDGNDVFFVGYGKVNYTIDVRMAGSIKSDGTGLSWGLIDQQPGSVSSYYNDLVILNGHFIVSGSTEDQSSEPFKFGCLTAYGEVPDIGNVMDNTNNLMDIRFCIGFGKMAVSPEYNDSVFVIGKDADDEYGTNERTFVGTISSTAIWQNISFPISPTATTSVDYVFDGISAAGSNPVKILVIGSAEFKYLIEKVNFNGQEFTEESQIIKNCPDDGEQHRCSLSSVRFIDSDRFIVTGSSNYRGWVFTGTY